MVRGVGLVCLFCEKKGNESFGYYTIYVSTHTHWRTGSGVDTTAKRVDFGMILTNNTPR